MRKINPNATCVNCDFCDTSGEVSFCRGKIKATTFICRRFPQDKEVGKKHPACGEHPDFFLEEDES